MNKRESRLVMLAFFSIVLGVILFLAVLIVFVAETTEPLPIVCNGIVYSNVHSVIFDKANDTVQFGQYGYSLVYPMEQCTLDGWEIKE